MLTANTYLPRAALCDLLPSGDEASQLGALRAALPERWVLELRADATMAWVALVYQAKAPRSSPMFTVCRWDDRVGLFVEWMDGSAAAATAFMELAPILKLILGSIFAFTQAHVTTVPTTSRGNIQQ